MSKRIIETFDTNNYEWRNNDAFINNNRFTTINRVRYNVYKNGNVSYYGDIVCTNDSYRKMVEAVKKNGGNDLSDLEFDILVSYKDKSISQLQTRKIKNIHLVEHEDRGDFHLFSIMFVGVENQ